VTPTQLIRTGQAEEEKVTKDDLPMFVSEKAAVIQKAARAMINAVFEGICSALEMGFLCLCVMGGVFS
jgi:nucleoid DNA-binding protein